MIKPNIVLIGFMGCGKTTVGKLLAKKLGFTFIDSDTFIENKLNMKISQIFEKYGEKYFREYEHNIIIEIGKLNNHVVATGGGVIKDKKNIAELKKKGIVLYLNMPPERIYTNIKDDNSRPLLQVDDKLSAIIELLNQRKPLYEMYADVIIDIKDDTVDNIVANIIEIVGGDRFE